MNCVCSKIPPNVRIINVGDSDVGLMDLPKIFREVYFLNIEDEPALKKELLERVKARNHVPGDKEELYAEALLREYDAYIKARFPSSRAVHQPVAQESRSLLHFLRKLAGGRRKKK